jgi:membrane protease subunit (stomatin/prohibitin family)
MSDFINKQLRSVIEWVDAHPDTLFERWTDNGDEIKSASKLIVGPGQGCIFVYEGKVEGTFTEEGLYDLRTDNIPFWTTIKNALYNFESYHKVGIYFFRKADILNKRWGTPSPITYNDPKYKFPVGLGAFGNFSFRITKPTEFFRNVVAGEHWYPVREIQNVLLSRITQPMSDYLANAEFGYSEIDKHRNAIADFSKNAVREIFENLGFELLDFRIEGTNFDDATQGRIGRISDMSAEAQALKELGIDYAQHQQLQAMRDMAKNEGQGNMGMQFGMGMEMAKMFGGIMGGNAQQQAVPVQQSAPQPVVASAEDPFQKLDKLKKMFEMGLINEQEYSVKKQEILSQL